MKLSVADRRDADMTHRVLTGRSFADVAREYELSSTRVQQIVNRILRTDYSSAQHDSHVVVMRIVEDWKRGVSK